MLKGHPLPIFTKHIEGHIYMLRNMYVHRQQTNKMYGGDSINSEVHGSQLYALHYP